MIIWIDRRPDLEGNPLEVRVEQWINDEPYEVALLSDQPVKLAGILWNIFDACFTRLAYRVFEEGLGYPEGGAGFDYGAAMERFREEHS